MKKVTAEWVKKAEADHRSMTVLRGQDPPVHDVVCFHAQQCAEKYLKGLMEELGLTILKTHDLDLLLPLLLPRHPSLKSLKRGTTFLSNFAVGTRYLGENASKRQAEAAARWAGKTPAIAPGLLGLLPPRRRRNN